jgi:hypothetical protein
MNYKIVNLLPHMRDFGTRRRNPEIKLYTEFFHRIRLPDESFVFNVG